MDTSSLKARIKENPRIKHFMIGLISSHLNPRPRLWVRCLLNPFLNRFVRKHGKHCIVRSRRSRHDIFPWRRFDMGNNVIIEDFTVLNNGAGDITLGDRARVGIGTVVIGPVIFKEGATTAQHVFVAGFSHGYQDPTRDFNIQDLDMRPVILGKECLIGANAVVLPGVEIGDRVMVGAGSVVTKDVPPYTMVAGNPARVIKRYDFEKQEWVRPKDKE